MNLDHVRLVEPRQCFYILDALKTEGGYVPALVTENEPGYAPMSGDPDKLQTPWVWGPTKGMPSGQAADRNAQMGLSPDDVARIVASSMGASRARRRSR